MLDATGAEWTLEDLDALTDEDREFMHQVLRGDLEKIARNPKNRTRFQRIMADLKRRRSRRR